MITTEAKALTMACAVQPNFPCRGTRCMAWRWMAEITRRKHYADEREAVKEPPRPSSVPASWEWVPFYPEDDEGYRACWREPETEALPRRNGYCGRVYQE